MLAESDWRVPEGVRKESKVWGVILLAVDLLDSEPLGLDLEFKSGSDLADVIFWMASFGGLVMDMESAVEGPRRRVRRSVLNGLVVWSTGVANVVMISGGGLGTVGIESFLTSFSPLSLELASVFRAFAVGLG